MNEPQSTVSSDEPSFMGEHRFSLLIIFAILIASGLVLISMSIYYNSGAAQLDLSRPGYKAVRAQVTTSDSDFQNYSATGPINQSAISEFKILYARQAQKTESVDAFGGDPLNPSALELTVVTE